MKFLKYILALSLLLTVQQYVNATSGPNTVSGYGCNLGNRIYTNKIGTSNFYGTSFDVYNSNGTNYAINWNNTSICNNINANAIVDQRKACWVNSYVNPTNNNSGISNGTLFYYSVETCTVNPPVRVPLDDYVWVFITLTGCLGAYVIHKKQLLSSQL